MGVEIELKARLDDSEPVKKRLSEAGEYYRSYTKSDTYWLPNRTNDGQLSLPQGGIPPSGVRVRRESGINADGSAFDTVLVTYKSKEITGGIEVNDESEFTVSAAAPLEELLRRLGLREAIRKEKKGWAWLVAAEAAAQPAAPPILAELSLVAGLGWFVELEIQADRAAAGSRRIIDESRRRLLALLDYLEIPPGRIEPRPYTLMLREA